MFQVLLIVKCIFEYKRVFKNTFYTKTSRYFLVIPPIHPSPPKRHQKFCHRACHPHPSNSPYIRQQKRHVKSCVPYCVKKVAVLNCWGKMRAWGCHMVHHALYQKQNYSYAGVIEALAGAPFEVSFISFADIKERPEILKDIDVLINVCTRGSRADDCG